MVSKLQIMKKMRSFVEDYSFDEVASSKKKMQGPGDVLQVIKQTL